MRSLLWLALGCGLLLGQASRSRADADAAAILDKAIKAHGGADKLGKDKATQTKTKGSIELFGGLNFTEETTAQAGHFKSVMDLTDRNVRITTVYNGKNVWLNVGDKTQELEGKALEEAKETAYLMGVGRLIILKEKPYELASLGELKVNERPAVGIKVSSKGHRDVNLFFDKETGLLAKLERQGVDPNTEKEFTEERIINEYQELDGAKVPKQVFMNRDGKKFIQVEVLAVKTGAKLDDSEFAKP